jgi:prophage tail gpP-like protein
MTLKIGARKLDFYNGVTVSLQYDSVASAFSFDFFFDPENADHRAMFRPGSYARVTIEHEGEFLITGTLLSQRFRSSGVSQLMSVSGYSKTGVLEDCEIPTSAYPLQSNGLTLEQITNKVIKPFGLQLVVDPSVKSVTGTSYTKSTASDSQTCKAYLAELAGQKHVMLTHDERGNLVLTRAKTGAAPIYDFVPGPPWVEMELDFDGQKMHSGITMIKQQTKGRKDGTHKKGNAGQASTSNPFVPSGVFRPRVNRQTSGQTVDTANASRNMLSDELAGIPLVINLDRWTLNNRLVRPNTIITVTNPDLYLFNKTRWFVAQVDYFGDHVSETCTLTCVLPSVFGAEAPKNIFA